MAWELTKVVLGRSEQQTEETNALSRQGWQPYAVRWNPRCGYTAWFRRPSRSEGLVHQPWAAGRDLPATLKLAAATHAVSTEPARLAATMQARR
jgi:hypothetical protein